MSRSTRVAPSAPCRPVTEDHPPLERKWRAVALLSLCEVMALALWFSATAIMPSLRAEFDLTYGHAALLTSSVAVGFVCGTLASAIFGLSDRMAPRRLFMISALAAAAANAAILAVDPTSFAVIALRFFTGACMAGLYPVGMKMAATWARKDTGLLVGLLVGALTVGSAFPHLFNAAGGVDWRFTLAVASALALGAGLLINFVRLGPNLALRSRFEPGVMLMAWRNKALRLANLGYFGHMWELYAMWAWVGLFLHASFLARSDMAPADAKFYANLATFAVIGIGALGCLLGGLFADRVGRTTLTMAAMAISGCCSLAAGALFGAEPWALLLLCLVWGIAVIADSAQFSSSVIELTEPKYVGTMLTMQTCIGFLITLATIHLIPHFVNWLGWHYAFAPLAAGPFLGVVAMARLRAHPEAVKLANGNR
jgi:MFS family permease